MHTGESACIRITQFDQLSKLSATMSTAPRSTKGWFPAPRRLLCALLLPVTTSLPKGNHYWRVTTSHRLDVSVFEINFNGTIKHILFCDWFPSWLVSSTQHYGGKIYLYRHMYFPRFIIIAMWYRITWQYYISVFCWWALGQVLALDYNKYCYSEHSSTRLLVNTCLHFCWVYTYKEKFWAWKAVLRGLKHANAKLCFKIISSLGSLLFASKEYICSSLKQHATLHPWLK